MTGPVPRLAFLLYRRHWRRMLFFSVCIAAGVAFLTGIGNLLSAIEASVAVRARELLAADVEVHANRPLDPKALAAVDRLRAEGHRVGSMVEFVSMLDPKDGAPFLTGVKAVDESYPFYGKLDTDPPGVRLAGRDCLLDQTAALLHGVQVGDKVRLGELEVRVAGLLVKEPDRTFAGFNLAPRLLIPFPAAAETGLLKFGARSWHSRLIALPPGLADSPAAPGELKARLERELADPYVSISAYTDADPSVRETLERVTTFFVLLSLVALLLGAVGMAASVTMFLNEQLDTAGTLRCLGLKERDISRLYGLLCLAIGVQGGLLGGLCGWAMSVLGLETATRLLGLVVPVRPGFDSARLLEGLTVACVLAVSLNFAKVRAMARIPPMDVLRERATRLPPTPWATAALALAGLAAMFAYAFVKSNSWTAARSFALALGGSSLAVSLLILGALALLQLSAPLWEGLSLRHGLLQLTRQKARTLVFLFTLSLGFTLLGALGIVHRSLSSEILVGRSENVPDLFLIDIQKRQWPEVAALIARYADGPAHMAPLIRARLTHVNGVPVVKRDPEGMTVEERARQRFLTREYNLTYKDALQDSEKLVAGRFWEPGEAGSQISLEESFCKRIGVRLGDRLAFDVQGRPIEAQVTSVRRVSWLSMQPNFFVVFPVKALEPAPQTLIASLKVRDAAKTAAFQKEAVKAFPNVSAIDLSRVLDNVQNVLGTLLGALRVLAWFCVGVGLLVLAGTLGLGRKERVEQAALYRTLGARRADLLRMDAVEFLTLGLIAFAIAAATSHALAFAASRQMKIGFASDPVTLVWMLAASVLLPVGVGLAVYWRAYGAGVLETIRREA